MGDAGYVELPYNRYRRSASACVGLFEAILRSL
jgi:hypothetical protein